MKTGGWVKARILLFLFLCFGFSWSLWGAAILLGTSTAFPLTNLLYVAGVFGPSLAGVIMALYFYSPGEKLAFIRRIFRIPKDSAKLVLMSMFAVIALDLLARSVSGILGLGNPLLPLPVASTRNIFLLFSFTLLLGPVSEELGWRGFFTDTLLQRYDFFPIAAMTGIVWGIWHMPLFFISGSGQNAMGLFTLGFWVFFIMPVVVSFLLLLLYLKTRRSIAAAILIHFTINISFAAFPMNSAGYAIYCVFMVLLVLLIYRMSGTGDAKYPFSGL